MTSLKSLKSRLMLLVPATVMVLGASAATVKSQSLYSPPSLPASNEVSDMLSDKDIPTGQGGFARDYTVNLQAGDHVLIELTSNSFDTIVSLIAADGATITENDDGPDGNTNSLLFYRISVSGKYYIRVRSFGATGMGAFNLKLTRLQPVSTIPGILPAS
ncbi:MAG: peptidase [Coleofasciculaceae cyanobacterium SM2_3_26]|nr:peptidase [Coleofasciculaceae cyanobacterium SM2_3_26]